MQKEDKTIPFLDVLLVIQKDAHGALGHQVYRKPTHANRYLHYNSFHHPSIKNSVCKTLINRAKTICEVDNIGGELERLRSVLKMNGYPKKFIDNAMKTRQHVREKTVSLPYNGSASHKIERWRTGSMPLSAQRKIDQTIPCARLIGQSNLKIRNVTHQR